MDIHYSLFNIIAEQHHRIVTVVSVKRKEIQQERVCRKQH